MVEEEEREGREKERKKEINKEEQSIASEFHAFGSSPSSQGATGRGDRLCAPEDRNLFSGLVVIDFFVFFNCRLWFG